MAEKVLPNPLSGLEIRNAILDRISQSLSRDGYLNPNLAYDFFSAKIKIEVSCHDCGEERKVSQEVDFVHGESVSDITQTSGEIDINPAPPTEVRVESGQPVPVLAKGKDGRSEIKSVPYSRKTVGKDG